MIYKEDMLQQTHDSEYHCCFDCKILKPITYAFISPILLVQFNWFCKLGGDNNEALTWGRDLINLFFAQRCLQTFFIFISRAPPSFSHARLARELADVFEKKGKKNKCVQARFNIPKVLQFLIYFKIRNYLANNQ